MVRFGFKGLLVVPVLFGLNQWSNNHIRQKELMKICCQEAVRFGDQKLDRPTAEVRHITVILNPIAGKRKARKLYSKWVEPILHLSGYKVSLVETDSPGQARELMKVMSNCEAVAIVGGDATVQEAIDGLLAREDHLVAYRKYPLAIIPVGRLNVFANLIEHEDNKYRNQKERLMGSTMTLLTKKPIRFDLTRVDLIKNAKTKDEEDEQQVVYLPREVDPKEYLNLQDKLSYYELYYDYVKPIWDGFKNLIGKETRNFQVLERASAEKITPCEGCSRCCETAHLGVQYEASGSWFSGLIPKSGTKLTPEDKRQLELAKRENPNCSRWMRINVFVR